LSLTRYHRQCGNSDAGLVARNFAAVVTDGIFNRNTGTASS
jgi:hypothetical protein